MALKMEDVGELAYGGIVTLAAYWDEKRISKGELAANKTWKKYATWAYLGIGLAATLMNAMGWMRKYDEWTERVSHGFIYALPGFVRDVMKTMGTASMRTTTSGAVSEAQRILEMKRMAAANRQLGAGKLVDRSYQEEFAPAFVV